MKEVENVIVNPERGVDRDMDVIEDGKDSSYTVSNSTSDIIRHQMIEYGYTSETMIPINKSMAVNLYKKDIPVYKLYPDNTEAQVDSINDIKKEDKTIMFGVESKDIPSHIKQ